MRSDKTETPAAKHYTKTISLTYTPDRGTVPGLQSVTLRHVPSSKVAHHVGPKLELVFTGPEGKASPIITKIRQKRNRDLDELLPSGRSKPDYSDIEPDNEVITPITPIMKRPLVDLNELGLPQGMIDEIMGHIIAFQKDNHEENGKARRASILAARQSLGPIGMPAVGGDTPGTNGKHTAHPRTGGGNGNNGNGGGNGRITGNDIDWFMR